MIKFFASIGIAVVGALGLLVSSAGYILLTTPRPTNIRSCLLTNMFHVRLCPADADYVKLKDISPNLRNAVIVSEDSTFYSHSGIDWYEMRESAERNWAKGEYARGGSTITQQLAKNVYLSQDKSIVRKLREIIIAIQLEEILKKDEILEKYLNVVQFGDNLYGIGPAARFYFKEKPSELTPAQSVFLAFLLPSPKKYAVSFRKKSLTPFAHSRMRQLVNRLYRFQKISADGRAAGLAEVENFFGASASSLGPVDSATVSAPTDSTDQGTVDGSPQDENSGDIILPPSEEEGPPEN